MTAIAQREHVRVVAFNKCGHTSIINTFMSHRDGFVNPEPATVNSHEVRRAEGYVGNLIDVDLSTWPEPEVVIAFLRNPVYRVLSAYQHFFVRTMLSISIVRFRDNFQKVGFTRGMSFSEFVDHLLTVDLTFDPHLSPCIPDLISVGGDRQYLLAPLELIGDCWPLAMDNVGLADVPSQVYHKNKGDYNPDDYLTPDLYDAIRELYSEDYNLWETVFNEARAEISSISDTTH